jgi:hypothetical protein
MLLFEQRRRRNILECQAVTLQSLTLFMRIDPIACGPQRKSSLHQADNKDRAEAKTAHVSGLQYPEAATIRGADSY